jgi:DNA-binding NtrC family response regulator
MKQIAVLIVEDSIYSADLNIRELKKSGFIVQYQVVGSKKAMRKALEGSHWDIILSENNIRGFDILQVLKLKSQLASFVPLIIVSEDMLQKDLIKAIDMGCCAYISKENLKELGQAVKQILKI